jgi:hypothetical protein
MWVIASYTEGLPKNDREVEKPADVGRKVMSATKLGQLQL